MSDFIDVLISVINFVDKDLAKSNVNRKLLNELFRNVDILRNPSASQKQKQIARQNIDKIVYAGGSNLTPTARSYGPRKDKDIDYSMVFPSPKQRVTDFSSAPIGYPKELPAFYNIDPKKFEENWSKMSNEERKQFLINHKKKVEDIVNNRMQDYINTQYSGDAPEHLKDQPSNKEVKTEELTLPKDFHEVFNVEPSNFIEAWHKMTPEQKKFMIDQYNNKKNQIKQRYAKNIEDIPDDQPKKINTGATKQGTLPKNVYDPTINEDLVFESSKKQNRKDPSTFQIKEKYSMPDDIAEVFGVDKQKLAASWSAMNDEQKKITLDYYNEKKKKLEQSKPNVSNIEFPSDFAEIHGVDPAGFKSAWENMTDEQRQETIRFHNEHKQKIKQPSATQQAANQNIKAPSAHSQEKTDDIPFHIAESYGIDKDEFANMWSSSSPEQKKSIMQWHSSVSNTKPSVSSNMPKPNQVNQNIESVKQQNTTPEVVKKPKQISPKPVKIETPHIKQSVAGASKPNKF